MSYDHENGGKFAEFSTTIQGNAGYLDEKEVASSGTPSTRLEWTEEEEKRLVKKIDCIVMPILILAFMAMQLDRGNIGNTLTDFFLRDVGITQDQYNVGQQLMWVGIVLLEIPSNYILYRVGPTIWISCQIFAWGLVATFQAFQKGPAAFYVTRLLLGLCESGFIPAGLYTITQWYKRDETSKRFSWYFIGNGLASALTGLIAYGVLHMRGVANLAGWQWLFILEGIFTLLVGVAFILFFPRGVLNPVSITKINYFNERERQILAERVLRDDPSKFQAKKKITTQEIKNAFANWRIYPHILITISSLAPLTTIGAYAPTLVNSFGYERLKSNAMTSVALWIQLVLNITWGYLADKFGRRGYLVLAGLIGWWAFVLGCRLAIYNPNNGTRYAILVLAYAFGMIWHPVNGSWMSLNAQSAGERSITLALFIMSANCSGIMGAQLFRSDDAPKYRRGWTVMIGLISFGLVCAVVANIQYRISNRRLRKKGQPEIYRY